MDTTTQLTTLQMYFAVIFIVFILLILIGTSLYKIYKMFLSIKLLERGDIEQAADLVIEPHHY